MSDSADHPDSADRTDGTDRADSARGATARAVARRLTAPLGVGTGVAAAAGYVAAVDPHRPGHYPACPLLRYTGLYCPGCGGLRGLHALCHGDLAAALGANALAVAGYAAFALLWAVWTVRALRGAGGVSPLPRPVHRWALGALVLAFTVVRNLPAGSALVP
ncbi:DUF2752 domain-containing protein [Streptomyces albireticuli]|uniref:DUF2752 domain-containing protein n=1 Tax=Streptomyces albireticuli TaxID=1940 RepID=UPI00367B0895